MRIAKTSSVLKTLFPSYVWNINTNKKVLYLTFDDGPTPQITEQVLDILARYNAKATFFCIGKNVKKHSEIFNRILKEGHSIGNHTYNHLKGWKTNTESYLEDALLAQEVMSGEKKQNSNFKFQVEDEIQSINLKPQTPNSNTVPIPRLQNEGQHQNVISTLPNYETSGRGSGEKSNSTFNIQHSTFNIHSEVKVQNTNYKLQTTNLFRPPYGRIKPKQAKQLEKLGYKIIMWDVLSYDWDKKNY